MNAIVQVILNLHGAAALALVFALPALEASAFLGVVIPARPPPCSAAFWPSTTGSPLPGPSLPPCWEP
jgi:hypothetical protein